MGDIFISYARPDEALAARISKALAESGFSVWRDDLMPGHAAFAREIETRLASARVVLVLWSTAASASDWVRAEADIGRTSGKLVQASLDSTLPPIPFSQFHCHMLGEAAERAPGFGRLVQSIATLVEPGGAGDHASAADPRGLSFAVKVILRPLVADSGDSAATEFASGLETELANALAQWTMIQTVLDGPDTPADPSALILDGRIRASAGRLRAALRLARADTGELLWSRTFDEERPTGLDAEADIAARAAAAIETSATTSRLREAGRAPRDSQDPALASLQAAARTVEQFDRETLEECLAMLAPFTECEDRRDAVALGWASGFHAQLWLAGWTENRPARWARALELARMAVKMAPANPLVLSTAAGALNLLGADLRETGRLLDRAESLNPNSPLTAFHRGWLHIRRNEPEAAMLAFERMLAAGLRTPFAPYALAGRAAGLLLTGATDRAEADLAEAEGLHPGDGHVSIWLWQAATRAAAGDQAGAREIVAMRRLREEQARALMPGPVADQFVRDVLLA